MKAVKIMLAGLLVIVLIGFGLGAYLFLPRLRQLAGEIQTPIPKYVVRYQDQQQVSALAVEQEINNFRAKNSKAILGKWEPLCEFAKIRAQEIKADFSHTGFEERTVNFGEGSEYEKFCDTKDIKCTRAGENLAKGYFDSKEVVLGWENSAGHRENMLGEYNVQCVAANEGYIVSLFAFTEDVSNIQPIGPLLTDIIQYDYDTVKYWEETEFAQKEYKKSWEDAYDLDYYDSNTVDELIKNFNKAIQLANTLWDGYTNSKITYEQAILLEKEFMETTTTIHSLVKQAYLEAYENCVKYLEDLEEEHNTDYSEEKKQCKAFLENT